MKPSTTDQELLAALEEVRKAKPDLGEIIDFHIQVIATRSAIEVEPPQLEVDELEVARLMDERTPLLRRWGLECIPIHLQEECCAAPVVHLHTPPASSVGHPRPDAQGAFHASL